MDSANSCRMHSILLELRFVLNISAVALFVDFTECLAPCANSLFTKEKPSTWLSYHPNRLTSSGWHGVPNAMTCAVKSTDKFRGSQGFLYHSVTGLCSPLLWLEGPNSPTALSLKSWEGDLYLNNGWCTGDGFQLLRLEAVTGELVCLKYFKSPSTYKEASKCCDSMGSYLTSVKTLDKLVMIRSLATTTNAWVGIDSLDGHMSWASDGQDLTLAQKNTVFYPGEPNNEHGSESCGEYSFGFQMLNDVRCSNTYPFICERPMPKLGG